MNRASNNGVSQEKETPAQPPQKQRVTLFVSEAHLAGIAKEQQAYLAAAGPAAGRPNLTQAICRLAQRGLSALKTKTKKQRKQIELPASLIARLQGQFPGATISQATAWALTKGLEELREEERRNALAHALRSDIADTPYSGFGLFKVPGKQPEEEVTPGRKE